MPLRDHSLHLNEVFFKEMKMFLETLNPSNTKDNGDFCNLLLDKYKECATKHKNPETECKSEMEVLFSTHCTNLLKKENSDQSS